MISPGRTDIALLDLRVLEFGDAVGTAVAGQRLALLGADVVIAEPASGCWLRTVPWATTGSNPLWTAWAAGKRSASLDALEILLGAADVVIASSSTVERFDLRGRSWDRQLLVVIDDASCPGELHAQAVSGMLSYLGSLNSAPVRIGFEAVGWASGVLASQAILASSPDGRRVQAGIVQIDLLRVAATLISNQIISHSQPDEWIGFAAYQIQPPEHGFRVMDGYMEIIFFRDDGGWQSFCEELGCQPGLEDVRFSTYPLRTGNKAELTALLEPFLIKHTAAHIEKLVRRLGGLVARRLTVAEAVQSEQVQANQLTGIAPASTRGATQKDSSVVLNSPWAINGRRSTPGASPNLLEHDGTIYADWIRPTDPLAEVCSAVRLNEQFVVDVTEGAQGPFAVSLLADLGASVAKIERPGGEFMRRVGSFREGEALPFLALNHGRDVSVELDLHSEEGRVIANRMARCADVFVENWRHGTADRLGLGPEQLQAANQSLVYVSASGFGSMGPLAQAGALDQISQAASGMWSLSGVEEGHAERFRGALLDYLSSLVTAEGALIGLIYRARHGTGPFVEVSQLASALSVCLPEVLLSPDSTGPQGARSRYFAPSSVYETVDNKWMVVEAEDEEQWTALRLCLECDELDEVRFATNQGRVEHYDELHALIARQIGASSAKSWVDRSNGNEIVEVARPLAGQLEGEGLLWRMGHVVKQNCRVGPVLRVLPPWEFLFEERMVLARVGPPLGEQTRATKRFLEMAREQ